MQNYHKGDTLQTEEEEDPMTTVEGIGKYKVDKGNWTGRVIQ